MSPRPRTKGFVQIGSERARTPRTNIHRPCAIRALNELNSNTKSKIHIYLASRSYSNSVSNAIHTRNEPRTTHNKHQTKQHELKPKRRKNGLYSLSESETDRQGHVAVNSGCDASKMVRAHVARKRDGQRGG